MTNTEAPNTNQYVYFSTGMVPDATTEFEIHAAGCQHVTKGNRKHVVGSADVMTATSAEELRDSEVAYYTSNDQGWTTSDFRIFPCAKAKKAKAAPKAKATKGTHKDSVVAKALVRERDTKGQSWAKVAKALDLASPAAARKAYSTYVRPHTESTIR